MNMKDHVLAALREQIIRWEELLDRLNSDQIGTPRSRQPDCRHPPVPVRPGVFFNWSCPCSNSHHHETSTFQLRNRQVNPLVLDVIMCPFEQHPSSNIRKEHV
jgi:hypothetical protein